MLKTMSILQNEVRLSLICPHSDCGKINKVDPSSFHYRRKKEEMPSFTCDSCGRKFFSFPMYICNANEKALGAIKQLIERYLYDLTT